MLRRGVCRWVEEVAAFVEVVEVNVKVGFVVIIVVFVVKGRWFPGGRSTQWESVVEAILIRRAARMQIHPRVLPPSVVSRLHTSSTGHPKVALVRVARAPRRKEHFDAYHDQTRPHGDQPRHGLVRLVPKGRQTRVCQVREGCWKEVHESGGDEHAGAEVTREEEEAVWDRKGGEAFGDYGKGACLSWVLAECPGW